MLNLQRRIYVMALAASAFLVAGVASAAADTTPDPNLTAAGGQITSYFGANIGVVIGVFVGVALLIWLLVLLFHSMGVKKANRGIA